MRCKESQRICNVDAGWPGFKNVADGDSYDDDGVSLFHVRGSNALNVCGVQVLPSRHALLYLEKFSAASTSARGGAHAGRVVQQIAQGWEASKSGHCVCLCVRYFPRPSTGLEVSSTPSPRCSAPVSILFGACGTLWLGG